MKHLCWFVFVAIAMNGSAWPQTNQFSEAAWDSFRAEQKKIRQSGTDALERERARRETDACEKAEPKGARAIVECLEGEARLTEQNYLTYSRAIGALLRLQAPGDVDQNTPNHLPFDTAEEAWQKYRDESCKSVSTQWIDVQTSISDIDCRLKLTWNHMSELGSLYSDLWH